MNNALSGVLRVLMLFAAAAAAAISVFKWAFPPLLLFNLVAHFGCFSVVQHRVCVSE